MQAFLTGRCCVGDHIPHLPPGAASCPFPRTLRLTLEQMCCIIASIVLRAFLHTSVTSYSFPPVCPYSVPLAVLQSPGRFRPSPCPRGRSTTAVSPLSCAIGHSVSAFNYLNVSLPHSPASPLFLIVFCESKLEKMASSTPHIWPPFPYEPQNRPDMGVASAAKGLMECPKGAKINGEVEKTPPKCFPGFAAGAERSTSFIWPLMRGFRLPLPLTNPPEPRILAKPPTSYNAEEVSYG